MRAHKFTGRTAALQRRAGPRRQAHGSLPAIGYAEGIAGGDSMRAHKVIKK